MKPRDQRTVSAFLSLVICLAASTALTSGSAFAQCARPGFKLNYGFFSTIAHKAITADFNADGKMDIATSAYADRKAAIYFGDGAGGFSEPVVYSTTLGPIYKILATDINNDARLDLVLIIDHFSANDIVSVLLNNGSGAFNAPVDTSFPFDLPSIQMADLNGDGKSDMVSLAFGSSNTLSVRLGDGLGNFATASTYAVTAPHRFLLGDFNGDGKTDVAVNSSTLMMVKIVLYLNNGSGGLTLGPETVLSVSSGVGLALDLNSDGKIDIAGLSFSSGNYFLMVLLNNGSGSFSRTDYPLSSGVSDIRAGDFNGDGKVDFIAGRFNTLDKSLIAYGNGTGGFTEGDSFGAAYGWVDQGEVGDFNSDGKTDLVVAQGTGVRAFIRTCNDTSNTKRVDYDGDGLTDFAVWRPSTGEWIIDQSATNTRRTQQWGGGSFGDVPVPGDYDGDGKSDLAVFRAPTGGWYILKSSDNSLSGVQWGASGDKAVPGDYDADGKTDVAVFRPSDGGWYILRSSDGALSVFVFGTNGDKPAQADFDNDDKTDVAVFRPSNGYWYILKSSDGSFSAVNFGISVDKPAPADYDGDGKSDIAVFRRGVGFYFLSSWNNVATGEADNRYAGTSSAMDLPAPVRRSENFYANIWRPASSVFGGLFSNGSGTIGMSGDIPVVTPYVVE